MSTVYLNGSYVPLEEAYIPVLDRGFIFGDGAYEVIPVFGDSIFRLNEHLVRLHNSLTSIGIKDPYSTEGWIQILNELLDKNSRGQKLAIYIQVSRGVGVRDHLHNENMVPTVFAMCKPVPERDFSSGVGAVTHQDIRWQYCHIKATSLLPGVLLKNHANNIDGSFESILIRDDFLTEGSASNVFIVKDKSVKTPKKDNRILSGITREVVIEILNESGIGCMETDITDTELYCADEIWITSSTMGIVPVVRLNGERIGDGKPGKIWRQANELYEAFIPRYAHI